MPGKSYLPTFLIFGCRSRDRSRAEWSGPPFRGRGEGERSARGRALTAERVLHKGMVSDGAEYVVQQVVEAESQEQEDQGWQAAQQL